jgi:hypothetical protein
MRYAGKFIVSTRLPWASLIAALRNGSGLLILILAFSLGAARGNVQAPATRPASADKAWIDANPLVLYPIAGNGLPPTAVALVADLRTGMERLLEPVKPGMPDRQLASPRGGTYPSLNSLRIDLTESIQQPNAPKIKIKKEIPARPGLSVDDFEFMAQPMHYCNGKLIYDLRARDARIDVRTDKDGHTLLVLQDASTGSFQFVSTIADLQSTLAGQIGDGLKKIGMTVDSVRVNITCPTPRTLHANATITISKSVLSATVRVIGTINVNDDMRATLTDFNVEGDGALGTTIAILTSSAAHDYQGTTRPLLAFPGDAIHLSDIHFTMANDTLTIAAAFAGKRPQAKSPV